MNDFGIDENFYDFIDYAFRQERMPKRYVRDAYNPLEWWNEVEFKKRYRFAKNTVVNFIQPLVIEALQKDSQRGLPIPPLLQVLCSLRFYTQ
jgi:hypothetical protein